uniref:Uncharacterized protein n=1 Tax=Cereibacter sphaeroides (strain ATCC 17025 / ATH 2.4.3) TaxID=349102 RepID=A4WZV9_CERS5
MRDRILMLGGGGLMALFAVLALRPAETVRLEGELGSMTPEAAMARLEAMAGRVELTDNLRLVQADLALRAGHPAAAERALAGDRPQEAGAGAEAVLADRRAEIARMAGDLEAAVRHLRRAQELKPDAGRRHRLGYWLRLLGDEPAELELLAGVPTVQLQPWEAGRLAQLLVRAGRTEEVEWLLRAAAEGPDPLAGAMRPRLLDVLLETGRRDEVVPLALAWCAAAGNTDPLEAALPVLINRGALAEAYALARSALEREPAAAHRLLPLFARGGHRAMTFDLQARWIAETPEMDARGWRTLLTVTEITGDLRGLRGALERSGPGLEPEITGRALLQFLRFQGPSALLPWQDRMTPDLVRAEPLVGAAFMGLQGRPEEVHRLLALAAARPLSEWDRTLWLSLAGSLRGTAGHADLMARPGANPDLPAALLATWRSPVSGLPGP